jgi:hypothetical protein
MSLASKNARWVSRAQALKLLELPSKAFSALVKTGKIRTRRVASNRRYWREDVERLAQPQEELQT